MRPFFYREIGVLFLQKKNAEKEAWNRPSGLYIMCISGFFWGGRDACCQSNKCKKQNISIYNSDILSLGSSEREKAFFWKGLAEHHKHQWVILEWKRCCSAKLSYAFSAFEIRHVTSASVCVGVDHKQLVPRG